MAELRPILVNILLFALVAMSLLTGGIMLASTNNAPQSIADEPAIQNYVSSLNATLEDSSADARSAQEAIETSPVTLTSGLPVFDAIFGIWRTIKEVPVTVYNLTIGLLVAKIFSSAAYAIVTAVIATILIVTIVLAVWKMVSTGDGG